MDKKLDTIHTEKLQAINYIEASTSEEVRKEVQKLDGEFPRKLVEMRKEIENRTHNYKNIDNYAESKIDNQ